MPETSTLQQKINQLEKEIEKIKERNKRVEADKAWELSYTRRLLLTIFTYLAVAFYLVAIKIPNPWLNAVVPVSKLSGKFFYRQKI